MRRAECVRGWVRLVDVITLVSALFWLVRRQPSLSHTSWESGGAIILLLFVGLLLVVYSGLGLYSPNHISRFELIGTILLAEGALGAAGWAVVAALHIGGLSWVHISTAMILHTAGSVAVHLVATELLPSRTTTWRVGVVAREQDAVAVVNTLLLELHGRVEFVMIAMTEPDQAVIEQSCVNLDLLFLGPYTAGAIRAGWLRFALLADIPVQLVPDPSDLLLTGSTYATIGDIAVCQVGRLALSRGQLVTKRAFDLVLTVPLLVVLSPVLALVFFAVKLTSPGPALFAQERVGQGGATFRILKFRTMVVDAEKETGPVLARMGDPRITPVGAFLRATRLDELPQLWNVLCGEMTLVGPRPERPYFVEQLQHEMPEYGLRHAIPPGITGLAQVLGRYGTSPPDKLRFDLYYIRNYSLWMDIRMLMRTVRTVLFKEGSTTGVGGQHLNTAQGIVMGQSQTVSTRGYGGSHPSVGSIASGGRAAD